MITAPAHAEETALPLFRPEHDELREAANRFVAEQLAPHVADWEATGDWPRDEVFGKVGAAGWFGLKFGEDVGGSGPDLLAQAVWVDAVARCGSGGLGADLGAHADLGLVYLDRAGDDEQRQRWLAPGVRGELVTGLGVTEPGTGSDVAGITTRARRDGADWVLDGEKTFITNGSWADAVVVAARTDPDDRHGGLTLFVVEADDPGFERHRLRMLGWRASHTGHLSFSEVRLPDDRRLGDPGTAFLWIMRNFAWERLTLAIGAVAAAEVSLERAIAFAREREVFGRTVASFQVWRHRFADLATRIELGRALTEHALRLHVAEVAAERGEGPAVDGQDVIRAVSQAKLFTQRMAFEVADECVQVHGGAGYLMEYDAQRFWRDARLGPIGGGTDEIMRELIGRTL